MSIVKALLAEIGGMFLADGRLPIWLVAWIAVSGVLAHMLPVGVWGGLLLIVGILAVLALNVLGAARAARK
jgi:hypothetical protein